jgi:NSS family neurotransmitter:Na+ symporter
VLKGTQVFGKGVLEATDWLVSNVLLPLGGIAIAAYVGWAWRREEALAQAGIGRGRLERLWRTAVRLLAPAAILVMLGGMLFT